AGTYRRARRHRGRHGHRHVPADLRHGDRAAVAPQMSAPLPPVPPVPPAPPAPREPRPARTGTLRHDTVPMRLYHDAKRLGAWDPRSLDLRRDVDDWARFTVAERDVLLRLTVLFQAAEESMTRDLLPLVMAVVREERLEEQLFLTTLLADEAKHTEFFRRVLDEVCRQAGDLQDAGYHLFTTALARGDPMPGFREGLRLAQADEDRHMAYGLHLLSRLVAEDEAVWGVIQARMDDLLPDTLGVVTEFFQPYDAMPFGLTLDAVIEYAMEKFAGRWASLEEARERARAARAAPTPEACVRDIRAWLGEQVRPAHVAVSMDGTGKIRTFRIGSTALLVTQEVLEHHPAPEIIAAPGGARVPP